MTSRQMLNLTAREIVADIAVLNPAVENQLHFRCVFCNSKSFGSPDAIDHTETCVWVRAHDLIEDAAESG